MAPAKAGGGDGVDPAMGGASSPASGARRTVSAYVPVVTFPAAIVLHVIRAFSESDALLFIELALIAATVVAFLVLQVRFMRSQRRDRGE